MNGRRTIENSAVVEVKQRALDYETNVLKRFETLSTKGSERYEGVVPPSTDGGTSRQNDVLMWRRVFPPNVKKIRFVDKK